MLDPGRSARACASGTWILLVLACTQPRESRPAEQSTDTPALDGTEAARRAEQLTGDWEREGQTLPPIHLRLWLERDTLRARLRLSGSESFGTAAFDGSALRLDLSGRPEPLRGKLVSAKELELRFAQGARAYRLRKKG